MRILPVKGIETHKMHSTPIITQKASCTDGNLDRSGQHTASKQGKTRGEIRRCTTYTPTPHWERGCHSAAAKVGQSLHAATSWGLLVTDMWRSTPAVESAGAYHSDPRAAQPLTASESFSRWWSAQAVQLVGIQAGNRNAETVVEDVAHCTRCLTWNALRPTKTMVAYG